MAVSTQRCSDCIYYQMQKLNGAEAPCGELGILGNNSPCNKFLYNYRNIDIDLQDMKILKLVHSAKDIKQLNCLIGMAEQEKKTRKYDLSIGDIFYIKLFPSNYISSYYKVVVLCADKNYVHIQGTHKGKVWFGEVYSSSLITVDDYEKIRKELKAKNKVVDPKFDEYFKAPENPIRPITYKKKTKKKVVDPLEEMADEILENDEESDGFIINSKKEINDDLPDIDEDDDIETDDEFDSESNMSSSMYNAMSEYDLDDFDE